MRTRSWICRPVQLDECRDTKHALRRIGMQREARLVSEVCGASSRVVRVWSYIAELRFGLPRWRVRSTCTAHLLDSRGAAGRSSGKQLQQTEPARMSLILSWLILSFAVWVTDAVLPGFHVKSPKSALLVAAIFGVLNFLL